jgi:hypothetical protein
MFPCSVSVHPVNLGELDLPTPFSLRSPRKSRSTGLERKHVMRTTLAAVTALAGSLLLPCLMLGSAQAVTSAPDLKNVISTTDNGTINGTITPVRGGGGGFAGGGGHMEGAGFGSHMGGFSAHMGGIGGGHIGGMGGHMGGFAGRTFHGGPRFAGREFDHGHFNDRHFVNDHHFNHRRVFVHNRFFIAGGPWWWGGSSCWWWNPRWGRWLWICD